MRRIVGQEVKKVLSLRIFYIFFIIALLWNGLFLWNNDYVRSDVKRFLQVNEPQVVWTNDMMKERQKMNQQASEPLRKGEMTLVEVYRQALNKGNVIEDEKFLKLLTEEVYWDHFIALHEQRAALQVDEKVEQIVRMYGLTGNAAATLRQHIPALEMRFSKLIAQEAPTHYAPNALFSQHDALFGKLMRAVLMESVLITILITALLTSYEREHRTASVVYSSTVGRKVQIAKWLSSLFVASSTYVGLFLLSIGSYIALYTTPSLWTSYVSSSWNVEGPNLFMTWYPFTFIQYVSVQWGIGLSIIVLVVCLTWAISLYWHQTYIATAAVIAILFLLFIVPAFISKSSSLLIYATYTLSTLIVGTAHWLMMWKGYTLDPHFEWKTLLLSAIMIGIISFYAWRHFKRKDWQEVE